MLSVNIYIYKIYLREVQIWCTYKYFFQLNANNLFNIFIIQPQNE